jgi:tight adherence protein B
MSPGVILIVGGVIAFILLIVGIVVSTRSEAAQVEERMGSSPVTDWLNKRMEKSSYGSGISRDLARADLKLKPAEYVALIVIVSFGTALVAWYVSGQNPIFILIGFLVGPILVRRYVKRAQGKRLQKFNNQLADMLNLMVNGLRAGYSVMQAMEAVSKELPSPICDEFRRVVQEMQLGISMEKSLENLLRRIPSDDLDLVITAMNVQREVGGNLAEILDTISYTIRERVRIKGEIRVMTSQVMYSGRMLSLMPIFVVIILWALNPEYMGEYTKHDACGYICMGVAALLIIIGYFVMNKIGDIEV